MIIDKIINNKQWLETIALHASHRYGGIPSSNLSAKVPAPTPGDEFALPDGGVLLANICSGAEEGRQSPATFYPG